MRLRYTPAMLGLALGLAALAPVGAHAQNATRDAVDIATTHFRQRAASFATTGADLADLAPTDAYTDAVTGTSYVYLRQRVNGIEVYNTPANAAVTRDGAVYGANAQFLSGLAARANGATPVIGAVDAMRMAATQLGIAELGTVVLVEERPELPGGAVYRMGSQESTARLYYYATEAGPVRLAWEVTLPQRIYAQNVADGVHVPGREHLWNVLVDAVTGRILFQTDLVAHDTWTPPPARPMSFAPAMPAGAFPAVPAATSASSMAGSYRVFGLPAESPNHGTSALIANPANATASPNGWHQAGANSYTVTRGNNVNAYLDRDGNNAADPSGQPDGGGGLVFDYTYNTAASPGNSVNRNAAVTSLFYWNNIVHDVLWHYGFTDAAGNFQMVNAGGGAGNDPVLAEAQDNVDPPPPATTRDYNNANFSTPPDGGSGRMQMFEWYGSASFAVNAPTPNPSIPVGTALFGGHDMTVTQNLVIARGAEGDPTLGCLTDPIANTAQVAGKIAVIERGTCGFSEKVRGAQAAGAAAVLIYNCEVGVVGCSATNDTQLSNMLLAIGDPDDITIPAVFMLRSAALPLIAAIPNTNVTITASPTHRDSDMDAGVIMHEFGHGVSNRLIGGPANVGCLPSATQEQAGEGWSDFIGVLITMRPGDTGATPRGVGTYLNFEPTNGEGIRNAPYSTDFAINDYTYQDVITNGGGTGTRGLSIPHGIGFAWATMLWEMTWELINTNGWSPDVYNASGTAGNQIALRLVIEGLKLTACNPGFVNNRDAILAANQALYGGAYDDQIWIAFARRGLGANASQGSSSSVSDGVADFTLPPGVATEPGISVDAAVVTAPAPNPVADRAELAITLAQPEAVRVEVFDALGRRVTLAHDGEMAAGVRTPVALDLAGVAPGVYVWRVVGESFAQSGRITVAH